MRERGDHDCDDKRRTDEHLRKQMAEDTCEKHGVFCCPECFDLRPAEEGA